MSSEPPQADPSEAAEASRPLASPPKEFEPTGTEAAAAAAPGATHDTNTVWVGNLPVNAGKEEVMVVFTPHKALDCVVMCVGSCSYAFVLLRSATEYQAALEGLRGSKVKVHFVRVKFTRNLWVGGISPSISKQEVYGEFQRIGKIEGVEFSIDQTFAYIDFEKLKDAISAFGALNGIDFGGFTMQHSSSAYSFEGRVKYIRVIETCL